MKAVAIGGGHGTAVTLRALRQLTTDVTGIVSVADNGGSTGRLREMLDVAAVGDLRKCLAALASPDSVLARYFEHRFGDGDLEGHALGNLLLAGLIDATGDLEYSVRAVGDVLALTGVVLPASTEGVTLVARTNEGRTEGQTEVAASSSIRSVVIEPRSAETPSSALAAIVAADLIVIGPGSLYTSVLAACVVPGIADALAQSDAVRVFVANLREQVPETQGYSLNAHVNALRVHGVSFDVVLVDAHSPLRATSGPKDLREADLTGRNGLVHDATKLASCLAQLVA